MSRLPVWGKRLNCCAWGVPVLRRGSGTLSHISADNQPSMVDVSRKIVSIRVAHARCFVILPDELKKVFDESGSCGEFYSKKGPIVSTAIIAGIQGAKKTSTIIPLCHPIPLEDCNVSIAFCPESSRLQIDCTTRTSSKTGVEMEALMGLSSAALCVYDMCKALSHDIVITDMKLMSKGGGKRDFHRNQ